MLSDSFFLQGEKGRSFLAESLTDIYALVASELKEVFGQTHKVNQCRAEIKAFYFSLA